MFSSRLLGVMALVIVIGAGCANRVQTDGTPCPCAPGWDCDKSGGEPGVCVKASQSGDVTVHPTDGAPTDGAPTDGLPWYAQDAPSDAITAALFIGTWKGYVENYTFASGSDTVLVVLSPGVQPGTLSGHVAFGNGAPPATFDPEEGYPPNGSKTFMQEGFQFHVMEVVVTGSRLRFKLAHREQWKAWCKAQTSYADESNPGIFACVHNWAFNPTGSDAGTDCYQTNPQTSEQVKVDCGKYELCRYGSGVCSCDASGCTVKLIPGISFDLTHTEGKGVSSLDGSIKELPGAGSMLNVRLQRQ